MTSLQFELDALTHRRTILDSPKLEFLNKHHLVRARSTEAGLHALTLRGQGYIKDAFPNTSVPIPRFTFVSLFTFCTLIYSTFTSLEYIEKIILALQGRMVTLMDLPTAAPYFFVSPAWDDAEARAMLDGISFADYQASMQGTTGRLRSMSPADVQAIADVLHAENKVAGVKPARFMTALRHAMSGMKVSPLGISFWVQKSDPPNPEWAERCGDYGCVGHTKDDRAFGRGRRIVSCMV